MKIELLSNTDEKDIQQNIISKIKHLINHKNLEPGDKLPAERILAEKFGVSRNLVREAIQKLEFYGILQSKPQSGTFVSIGKIALNGMIDDILRLTETDFKSLVETRILLELKTVKLAAKRRSAEDLKKMKAALDSFSEKVIVGEDAVQEDLLFHLAIARASGNSTLNTYMLVITPEIIISFEKYHICDKDTAFKGIEEHKAIYKAIKKQKPKLASKKMKEHFKELYSYCYNI